MKKLYDHEADFEADVTIFSDSDGGRKSPPMNGVRWDFIYAENNPVGVTHMIWPEFIYDNGDAIEKDVPLLGTLKTRMHILDRQMAEFHSERIVEGTKFYCVEGRHRVAMGVVTRVRSG